LIAAGTGATGLAITGFPVARYVIVATILIISGLLLLRSGHRRAAQR
jgi:hypothetical protein